MSKKNNKAQKDAQLKADYEQTIKKKNKKTFMQWAVVGPITYIFIGVVLVFAGFYGIAKPDTFNSDGTATYVTTLAVFFVLGAFLIVQGWRIKTGKAEMPKFKFFSNK